MNKFAVVGMVVAGVSAGFAFLNARVKKNESKAYMNTLVRAMEGTTEAMKDPEVQAALETQFKEKTVVGEDGLNSIDRNLLQHLYVYGKVGGTDKKVYIQPDGTISFFDLNNTSVACIDKDDYKGFDNFKAAVVVEKNRAKAMNN